MRNDLPKAVKIGAVAIMVVMAVTLGGSNLAVWIMGGSIQNGIAGIAMILLAAWYIRSMTR